MSGRTRRRAPAAHALCGLTLIELMVALMLLGVLGVMSFRAVSTASESRQQLAQEFQRWRDITRFLQMAEVDLLQIVARPQEPGAPADGGAGSLQLTGRGAQGGVEFSFLKLDGANSSLARHGYRLEGDRIVLARWPGGDTSSAPIEDVVLQDVRAMHVTLITRAGQRSPVWPPRGSPPLASERAAESWVAAPTPAAVEITLELPDAGSITRLFAIR